MRLFLASVCVVASLLFSGCEPVPVTPSSNRPTIFAFSASWCTACKRDEPRLNQLEQAGNQVWHIDIDVRTDLRQKYSVNSVPLYLVVRNGRIVLRTNDLNLVIRAVRNGRKIQEQTTVPELSGD
jgi:thiol-disulfide isomerase/thioredoxin